MIKFLVMDVDGTLTDGKIYMGVDGECFKAFDIKDGYALHTLLKENGIIPVIITARNSLMVEHRCKELGVTEIHQGVMNKLECLNSIIKSYSSDEESYDFSNVAYIGDDLLDLQCMSPIKGAGGITGCPADAVKNVLALCDYIAPHKGGEGAVRDFVEYLIAYNEREAYDTVINDRCKEAIDYLLKIDQENLSIGRHEVNEYFFYNVIEYKTTNDLSMPYESHIKYIDIQIIVSGEEFMQVDDVSHLQISQAYDEQKDCTFYSATDNNSGVVLRPGSVLMLYPKDAHRSVAFNGVESNVVKIVGKVMVIKKIKQENRIEFNLS